MKTPISGSFLVMGDDGNDTTVSFTATLHSAPEEGPTASCGGQPPEWDFEDIVTDPPGYEAECEDHLYDGGDYDEDEPDDSPPDMED